MPATESHLSPETSAAARPESHGATASAVDAAAIYLVAAEVFDHIYGPDARAAIASRVSACDQLLTPQGYRESSTVWPEVEMIFSGWGMVPMDEAFFRRFPKVKIIFYGAGTVRGFVTNEVWRRHIRLTHAAAANAISVAEFTVAQIVLTLKQSLQQSLYIREHGKYPPARTAPGTYQSTVGLISLGAIGRLVAERLQHFDMKVIAYDPLFPAEEAAKLGVRLLSLEEVFATADVVSCHTPVLKETEGMIRRHHFEAMKSGATFINTARGQIVHEEEMIAVLQRRPDLFALLDVTTTLPPAEESPLFRMENVILTPHIAGSLGQECRRMGQLMVEELDRYLDGQPLRYEIDEKRFRFMA
jgi:phosphoglycerate dehydrogenase-like enzyme